MTGGPGLPYVTAADVAARLDVVGAVAALEAALRAGLDPEDDPPRESVAVGGGGELLVMPSAAGGHPAVKLLTVGGRPRIQGVCVVFDGQTLAPVAVVDGIALTNLRTAATSALAVHHLAIAAPRRLVVFGRGPQAHAHVAALRAIRPSIDQVDMVGRDGAVDVAGADVICCCTTARTPLFDGARVAAHAAVVAIGSHERAARETDDVLAARDSTTTVARASALREAGDVLGAIAAGALSAGALVPLADVVCGTATIDCDRPRLFKSTGMAWEDAVVAAALTGLASPAAGAAAGGGPRTVRQRRR
jgi:ornithine cyclodeaminase/alanine dehydrogenase-like protein (mu-crystallin family)